MEAVRGGEGRAREGRRCDGGGGGWGGEKGERG